MRAARAVRAPRVAALAPLLLVAVACRDSSVDPVDHPDARRADARLPDARTADAGTPDAGSPDAQVVLDRDGDGTNDAEDCAPRDVSRWRTVPTYLDVDRDRHGVGDAADLCIGVDAPVGRALDGTDCDDTARARFQMLAYAFRDADGDGRYVPEVSAVCAGVALPGGYRSDDPRTEVDCAPEDRTRWAMLTFFPDEDGDGAGAGTAMPLCAGDAVPDGYSRGDADCAPTDRGAWQVLTYSHRDADGDGATVPATGGVCTGVTLPPGYFTAANGHDCAPDDASMWRTVHLFADTDGDRVGAGASTAACIGAAAPVGTSLVGTDCNAVDAARWAMLPYQHVDHDGDGATTPERGAVCSGAAVLPPYYLVAIGNDCDDGDEMLERWAVLYTDEDGDGVGRPPHRVSCLGDTIPDGMSTRGYDVDDADPNRIEDEEDDEVLFNILF